MLLATLMVLAVLGAATWLPVEFALSARRPDPVGVWAYAWSLHFVFGWVRVEHPRRRASPKLPASKEPNSRRQRSEGDGSEGDGSEGDGSDSSRQRRRTRPKKTWRQRWRLVRPLLSSEVIERVLGSVLSLVRRVRIHELSVSGEFGLDDPMVTGMAWGCAFPVLAAINTLPNARIELQPRFFDAHVFGAAEVRLTLRPTQLLWAMTHVLGSTACWRAAWNVLRAR